MTTFAAVRRQNLLRTLLSTGRGAEEVLYLPGAGPGRTITACVSKAARQLRDRQYEQAEVEEIDVRISREEDASDTDASGVVRAIGGVARPALRDRLVRSGIGETAGDAYSFAFVIARSPDSWLLRFERHRVTQVGIAQTQKV